MCEGPTFQALIGYHKEVLVFNALESSQSHICESSLYILICCKRINVSPAPWSIWWFLLGISGFWMQAVSPAPVLTHHSSKQEPLNFSRFGDVLNKVSHLYSYTVIQCYWFCSDGWDTSDMFSKIVVT